MRWILESKNIKLKILYIISSADIGGAEKVVYLLTKYLNKDRFEIYIICPKGLMFDNFKQYAKEIKAFNFKIPFFLNLFSFFSLISYIKKNSFHIIHTHLFNADLLGIIVAKLCSVPIIVSTIHGFNFFTIQQYSFRNLKNRCFSKFYRIIYFFVDKIIAISFAIKEDLTIRPGIRLPKQKIEVIYNAVELNVPEKIIKQKNNGLLKDINSQPTVTVVANFDPIKGHRLLLSVILHVKKEMPDIKFLLKGEGKEKKQIKRLVNKYRLKENVIFIDASLRTEYIISLSNLIVVPSLMEGAGIIILEAMAQAKPVVATRVGGIPELVDNLNTGLLASSEEPKEMAEAILYLIKDNALAIKMGEQGLEELIRQFPLEKMIQDTENIYLKLTKEKIYTFATRKPHPLRARMNN